MNHFPNILYLTDSHIVLSPSLKCSIIQENNTFLHPLQDMAYTKITNRVLSTHCLSNSITLLSRNACASSASGVSQFAEK